MAPAPILCVCVFIRVGRERRSPVQEANTVYISIMNQVPERGRERERKKKKSGRKGDPFFSTAFPPSSRKPLRLVFLRLVIWSLCFIFLSWLEQMLILSLFLSQALPCVLRSLTEGRSTYHSLDGLSGRFPHSDIALVWNALLQCLLDVFGDDNSQIQAFWIRNMHVFACSFASEHPKSAVLCWILIRRWHNVFLSPSDAKSHTLHEQIQPPEIREKETGLAKSKSS